DGLDELAAPGCAEAADELLDGGGEPIGEPLERPKGAVPRFDCQFTAATSAGAKAICEIAADPAFITALTWQNPRAAAWIEGAATAATPGPDKAEPRPGPGQRNYDTRRREEIIAKYWQRYCVKNDSVGFFGPVCWVQIDPAPAGAPLVRATHGPGLIKSSQVFFERWALRALAD